MSYEPALEEIDIQKYIGLRCEIGGIENCQLNRDTCVGCGGLLPSLDWVICGRETGMKARYFTPKWACSVRDQCVSADVPFFYKNGLLDGVEWHQFPEVQS